MSRHVSRYGRILLVIDLAEDSDVIAQRAQAIAARNEADIVLLHVVEYMPVEPMGEALLPSVQLEARLVEDAEKRLAELSARLGLNDCRRLVATGNTKTEILRAAHDLKVDLIVLGSRERHGLAILVNQTEDTILHAAPCDVLAVRIK